MYKKNLKNNSGFTLVEVLVSVAICSVIAAVVANQLKLSNKSRIASNSNSVVNVLRDKLIIALSNEKTCTANFFNTPVATTTSFLNIKDSENNIIIDTAPATYYGQRVGTTSISNSSVDSVKINSIQTIENAANPNELILTVKFGKRTGFDGLFSGAEWFSLPLNIVKTGGNVRNCFNDATLSIATAIRLSCGNNLAPSNSSYYDPNANLPYGQCQHIVQPTLPPCPAGKFMNQIGINLSGAVGINSKAVEYNCKALESTCPAGLVITNTNPDGTVSCGYPLPNCAPGQMMVMSAGGNYICLNTNSGCSGLFAIKRFNSDGSVQCAQFYPPQSCIGFVKSISPGSIACDAYVKPVVCPFGSFISKVDVVGQPICTPWITLPATCPAGQGAIGIDAAGMIKCQLLDKRTSCSGSISASNTFNKCAADGGTVINRFVVGSTDAYCQFNSSFCPGTWSACSNRRYTINNNCTDQNSACAYSVQTRTALGAYFFGSYFPATITCVKWWRNSGPWVNTCTPAALPVTSASTIQVGCY